MIFPLSGKENLQIKLVNPSDYFRLESFTRLTHRGRSIHDIRVSFKRLGYNNYLNTNVLRLKSF